MRGSVTKFRKSKAVAATGRSLLPSLDTQVANDKEQGLRVRENDARLKAKLSRKVPKTLRRDPLEDRDIFEEIQTSLKAGASIQLSAKQGAGVIRRKGPLHSRDWKNIKAEDRKEKKQHKTSDSWIKTVWVPHWDHTGDQLKGLACAAALFEEHGRSLSLHLGQEVIDAGRVHPLGFAAYVRRRIARELKSVSATMGIPVPDYFFVIEDTDITEVHLHGAVMIPEGEQILTAVRTALKKAGGDWKGKASGRQLDTAALETPARWIAYINKWHLGSALRVQGKTFAASNGMRSKARAWYQNARSSGLKMRSDIFWHDFGSIPL